MSDQKIDLWTIQLESDSPSFNDNLTLLSDAEKARMDRFHFDKDKLLYASAHASLRRILAGYLSIDPKTIRFTYNSYAKPALVDDQNHKGLHFNLSHSKGLALVAVSLFRPVGVDVEQVKSLPDPLKLAERHFAAEEIECLKQLNSVSLPAAFIQLWAAKEALVKARGSGMSTPLDQFNLAALISGSESQGCTIQDPGDGRPWFVSTLRLTGNYLGAVAIQAGAGMVNYLIG